VRGSVIQVVGVPLLSAVRFPVAVAPTVDAVVSEVATLPQLEAQVVESVIDTVVVTSFTTMFSRVSIAVAAARVEGGAAEPVRVIWMLPLLLPLKKTSTPSELLLSLATVQ